MTTRADIVAAARGWLGTPFHHACCLKGVGVDCDHLLIGVARELGLVAPDFDVPAYLRAPDGHRFLAECDRHLDRIAREAVRAGDAVVVLVGRHPAHIGIVGASRHGLTLIHASSARSTVPARVIETRLVFHRALQFVAAYKFRGVECSS